MQRSRWQSCLMMMMPMCLETTRPPVCVKAPPGLFRTLLGRASLPSLSAPQLWTSAPRSIRLKPLPSHTLTTPTIAYPEPFSVAEDALISYVSGM